jgi:hypothetical protein
MSSGGKRKGAGRPAVVKDAKVLTVRISAKDYDTLHRLASARSCTASDLIRELLEQHLRNI